MYICKTLVPERSNGAGLRSADSFLRGFESHPVYKPG